MSCEAARSDYEVRNAEAFGGRCTRCQRLFQKGNYCPVCERVCARLRASRCAQACALT